ncbi:hypothetical protein KSD_05010 [Ktedonobacter sp. SOSP1-85]|uniref:hypothetical protein n=1 Tax=Ktedonobacter sp. SOSP1-85 TaxID=2778367 RepID=UPI001916A446|nr:hypothetical protein [Ktedonobacter sp. SOSP1-85]GHO72730.1 hypothetical protein KSD_05010 [Ktedonobacter sp. SOSP1-85]
MPKPAFHSLIWSQANHTYDLLTDGEDQQSFGGEDEAAWRDWLEGQSGFSFQG